MDELDIAYVSLARARDGRDWEATRRQLAQIASLHACLRETEPSTVIGAAHLLREAAALLLRSNTPYYGDRLRDVATRLDEGQRRFSDLVWLRGVLRSMSSGECGRPGENAAGLIGLALKGAARPIVLYRAVMPPARHHEPLRTETGH
jgi:hypothetical protein